MPEYDLNEVKNSIDLREFVIQHGGVLEGIDNNRRTGFVNPSSGTHNNFVVYHNNSTYMDYMAWKGGDVFDYCQRYLNMGVAESFKYCAEYAGIAPSDKPIKRKSATRRAAPIRRFPASHSMEPALAFNRSIALAKPYLCDSRKLPEWVVEQNLVGFRSHERTYVDRYHRSHVHQVHQVVLPDFAMGREDWVCHGWQFRRDDLYTEEFLYMKHPQDKELYLQHIRHDVVVKERRKNPRRSYKEFNRGHALDALFGRRYDSPTRYRGERVQGGIFGLHHVAPYWGKPMDYIILCEGAIDAMSLMAHGYTAVRAPLNPNIDYNRVFANFSRRYVVQENDTGGTTYARKMMTELNSGDRRYENIILDLPNGSKDIGDLHVTGQLATFMENRRWGIKPLWIAKETVLPAGG